MPVPSLSLIPATAPPKVKAAPTKKAMT